MDGAMTIAASGLSADTTWLNQIASNVANMRDEWALGSGNPFRSSAVGMSANAQGGVSANVTAKSPSTLVAFDPTSPLANTAGLVGTPNVDLVGEIASQSLALESYRANVVAFKTAIDMTKTALDTVA